jgi:hypothetical protein
MDALQEPDLAISDRARSTLRNMCRAGLKERSQAGSGPAMPALAAEWVDFLESLSSEVRVMLVILPELSAYRRYAYSPKAMYNTEIIVERLRDSGRVEVVDLSEVFARQGQPECGYFLDALHLNNPGKQAVTDALLPRLEAFWQGFEAGG